MVFWDGISYTDFGLEKHSRILAVVVDFLAVVRGEVGEVLHVDLQAAGGDSVVMIGVDPGAG